MYIYIYIYIYLSLDSYISIYMYIHIYIYISIYLQPRVGPKLTLSGQCHSVECWGLPTRRKWAWAPYRGGRTIKLGPWLDAWPSGICVCLGCRNFALSRDPAAKSRPRPWGDSLMASWGFGLEFPAAA